MTVTLSRTAAATLAAFCAELRWDALPADARERTKELVLDHLGVAVRGSTAASSVAVHEFVRGLGSGSATVLGGGMTAAAPWAALANGASGHAPEMDDVTTESSLHPGVAVIPAALALAEETGAAGPAFLEAVVGGYEVTMRVGNALDPASSYERGFHPTGVAGVFGAAVAAGRLLGLDRDRLVHAIGVAGTMASGSMEYLADGAWTKRLNPAWAAHAGIVAAGLARTGFTGPASALDGRFGVLRGYTDHPLPDRLVAGLGDPLMVTRVSIKPYACCRYNHGLIDAVLRLRREHGLRPDEVARMRLGVLSGGWLLVADPIEAKREPRSSVDAQFSAPYAAAVALVHGRAGLAEYADAAVGDATVRAVMARTECVRDASLDAVYPARWPAAVEVDTRDGRTLRARVDHALGEPENPVPRGALVERFVSLVADRVPGPDARAVAARVLALDEERDLSVVRRLG